MTTLPRRIAIALVACLVALVAVGAAFWVMLAGEPVDVDTQLPTQAMTAPMIGVVVFWLAGRAFRVPLDPVKTFLFGAIVVYGTLYFFGRIVAFSPASLVPVGVLCLAVVFGFAMLAVHRAVMGVR